MKMYDNKSWKYCVLVVVSYVVFVVGGGDVDSDVLYCVLVLLELPRLG